jgi:methoxymalonate biosynthesis acyl carrier protein
MDRDTIKTQLRGFIRERFQVPEHDPDFSDEVHLFDYGYVDSFGAVDLTSFVEQKFSVKIAQTDLIAFPMNTIVEISDFVSKRLNGQI